MTWRRDTFGHSPQRTLGQLDRDRSDAAAASQGVRTDDHGQTFEEVKESLLQVGLADALILDF